MRKRSLSMLSCAALLMACQQITTIPIKTQPSSPNLETNDDLPVPSASMAPPVPQAPPPPSVPTKTLSLGLVDQNSNQTDIDLVISTVTTSNETLTNLEQASPDITPTAATMPENFDPTKIIGFATPVLVHNLGKAHIVRQEGSVKVWQYQFGSCVVDFFFYPFVEGSSQLVLKTWVMRSTIMGDLLDRDSCRNEMNLYRQKLLSNS